MKAEKKNPLGKFVLIVLLIFGMLVTIIPGIQASDITEEKLEIAPKYNVDKSSNNWVVSFESRVKVRIHTSRNWAPYSETYGSPKNQIIVKPGQWIEMYIFVNGRWTWSLATDCDHR